jgi:hypothetical protein
VSDHIETVVLDHTTLIALYDADDFFTGLYIEASHQRGRIVVPSLCVRAAESTRPGAGAHAARLRYADHLDFTTSHALQAASWPRIDPSTAHAAAIAWEAGLAGAPVTVLSLQPELYAGTGITPLNPHE